MPFLLVLILYLKLIEIIKNERYLKGVKMAIKTSKDEELDFSNLEAIAEGELFNSDFIRETEEEFRTEITSIKLPSLEEYAGLYPDYFMESLIETLKEGFQLFNLSDNVRTPLVWLLVNNPNKFLSACDWYSDLYLNISNKLLKKNDIKLSEKALMEIRHLKEEFENYLLKLNFTPLRKRLQKHISGLYLMAPSDDGGKEKYEEENIKPLELKYAHILYSKEADEIKFGVIKFYRNLKKLDNLLQEKGHYAAETKGF